MSVQADLIRTLRKGRFVTHKRRPLRYRLPNPPPAFVGRREEAKLLGAAIRRAPVTLLHGAEGIGKTALMLHTLHQKFASQADRTLYLRATPLDPNENIRVELVRVLAAAEEIAVAWNDLLRDADALTATAIDLAESSEWWIVVEDVHHWERENVSELMDLVSRYGRKSRWIFTSEAAFDLGEQAIALGPLSDEQRAQVALSSEPSPVPRSRSSDAALDRKLVFRRALEDARTALWMGDHAGLDDTLTTTLVEFETRGDKARAGEAAALLATLRMLRGQSPADSQMARWRRRAGEALTVEPTEHPLVVAEAALLEGRTDAAHTLTTLLLEEKREPETLQLRCEILAATGNVTELAAAAAELEQSPSPRFVNEARFFAMVASPEPPDPSALNTIASSAAHAPVAARRAQALFGTPCSLDRLDDIVLAGVNAMVEWMPIDKIANGSRQWRPTWGLDTHRRHVWLPNGRTVDISRRGILWSILTTLANAGGSAAKETIVLSVWQEPEYHPLRHDNRLQVAIHDLRKNIEDDPSSPTRVITTETGYALAGEVRRL